MARYKLGIFEKKEGRILELKKEDKIETLRDLDEYTTKYKNEGYLKLHLLDERLITVNEMKQNTSIKVVYRNDGKIKKIPVFYEEMKVYLDGERLREKLHSLKSNLEFLEKLANFYSNGSTTFNKQGLNVSNIRVYISDVIKNDGKIFHTSLIDTTIDDLFIKAVKNIDRKTGEVKDNYRGLRDLALFVFKFENKLGQNTNEDEFESNAEIGQQIGLFEIPKEEKTSSISIDLSEAGVLSSDGDPDFPPNSEEEAMYNKYLEELEEKTNFPIEEHDHYRRR